MAYGNVLISKEHCRTPTPSGKGQSRKRMPVGEFHFKRNATLQNNLAQKQADSVGHGNAQLIEYHLSLLFYLGFDSRKYI